MASELIDKNVEVHIYDHHPRMKLDVVADKDVYEDVLSDSRLVKGLMQNEPRALMEWSKKMGDALGQEASSEYKDMLKRLDKGEEIETAASDYLQKETEPKRPPPSS